MAFQEAHKDSAVACSSSPDENRKCWQFIWSCNVPPTVRNFAWRLSIDSLPTWKTKHKIGLESSSGCPVCGMEVEGNFHPFVRCQFGRDLYLSMADVWNLPALSSFQYSGKEWLLRALGELSDIQRCNVLLIFWRS